MHGTPGLKEALAAAGIISYLLDGKPVTRAEALAAWRRRDTSPTFQGCELLLSRAEDTDSISAMARASLAKVGITVRHATGAAAGAP